MSSSTSPQAHSRITSSGYVAPVPKPRHRARRALVVTASVVAVLLALFYVGGGWYFSSRIESGALEASPGPMVPTYNLAVVAVDAGSVTYESAGDLSPSFAEDSVYALLWDGGWAHVGVPTSTTATTVTRPLSDVEGVPLGIGTRVALERDWYVADPDATNPTSTLGYAYEDVVISSTNGDMPGWWIPADEPSTWTAVLVHGREGFPREMLRQAEVAHEAGLDVLVITYLGDYGNPPYPDGYLGWGATEWPDVEAAVQWATERGATDVVLVGSSHGGSVVSAFLRESAAAESVSAVVLDSAVTDLGQTVEAGAADIALPVIGSVPSSLVSFSEWIAGLRFGVDWDYLDYVDDETWDSVPVLAIHGTEDPSSPVEQSRELAALHPQTVQLVEFDGAQHVESWNHGTARYQAVLRTFLEEQMTAG